MKQTVISLRGVGMEWEGNAALHGVDLDIERGDFVAITGPNGGGKTTLLRIILKLLKPSQGVVTYYGADGRPVKELPIGYLPQKNLIDQRFPLTVSELIAQGLVGARGMDRAERSRLIADALRSVELEDVARSPIGKVSGGQLQRALLGRAIVSSPAILVLDEPLSYIDKHFEHKMYTLIAELAKKTTVILVSHEMSMIASMANRHLIVDGSVTRCRSASHMVHYDCGE